MQMMSKASTASCNFGEDLSSDSLIQIDLIKIYDDFVNDPINANFQKTLLQFQIGSKSLMKYNGFGCIKHVKAY